MWRVVKQLIPNPQSGDPAWAQRNTYVAKLSGSADQVWEYTTEAAATEKINIMGPSYNCRGSKEGC